MTIDSNSNYFPLIANAQNTVAEILAGLSSQDLADIASVAFGNDYDRNGLEDLQQQWLNQDFTLFPNIEIITNTDLNGANGAFSSETNKIYLNADFLATSSSDSLVNLLLEEYGHLLDSQISPVDSPGDEGAIFSALVGGVELSATDLATLKTEDDSSNITLDNTNISVEQQIIGAEDNRELVTNTTEQSWKAIAWISAEWDHQGQSGNIFGATGSLFLSPYHVLTTAHAVWNKAEYETSGNGYASSITVNFGQSGQERFYGTANVTSAVAFDSWTEDSNWRLSESGRWIAQSRSGDIALLTLDRNLGDFVGYFEHRSIPNSNLDNANLESQNSASSEIDNLELSDLDVKIAGYPFDLAERWRWQHGSNVSFADAPNIGLYQDSGTINEINNGVLRYQLDTTGGQSGAPILHYDPETASTQIVGIHSAGSANYNFGVQLTEDTIETIRSQIVGSSSPENLADFVDYDFWFGSDYASFTNESTDTSSQDSLSLTIKPGEDFTVRSLVRNNGTASNNLPLTISFFASVDSTIDSQDYLLGEVSLAEIAPFEHQEAITSSTLPDLNPGDYYIGWIIDSGENIAEFIESNNTSLLSDFMLTVE